LQLLHLLLQCRNLNPERFRRVAQFERDFHTTIRKGATVEEMARRGEEFVSDKPEELRWLLASTWPRPTRRTRCAFTG
jgi:hypothetical protein